MLAALDLTEEIGGLHEMSIIILLLPFGQSCARGPVGPPSFLAYGAFLRIENSL